MPSFTNRGTDANKALAYDLRRYPQGVTLDLVNSSEYAYYTTIVAKTGCTARSGQSFGQISYNFAKILFVNRTGTNQAFIDSTGSLGMFSWNGYPASTDCSIGAANRVFAYLSLVISSARPALVITGGNITSDAHGSNSASIIHNTPLVYLPPGTTRFDPVNFFESTSYPTLSQIGVGGTQVWRGPIKVTAPATRIVELP